MTTISGPNGTNGTNRVVDPTIHEVVAEEVTNASQRGKVSMTIQPDTFNGKTAAGTQASGMDEFAANAKKTIDETKDALKKANKKGLIAAGITGLIISIPIAIAGYKKLKAKEEANKANATA